MKQNFMWIFTSTWYVLHNYKVSGNSVERFKGVALTRKTGLTDCLTAGRPGQNHYNKEFKKNEIQLGNVDFIFKIFFGPKLADYGYVVSEKNI